MRDFGDGLGLVQATGEGAEEIGPFVVRALHHQLLHDSLLILLLQYLTFLFQTRQILALIRKHVTRKVPILVFFHFSHLLHPF